MSDSLPVRVPPPPAAEDMDRLWRVLGPARALARPVFLGEENIPTSRPLMFVGNHTRYGVLDAPHLFVHLFRSHGIALRSLGDHAHWRVPAWRDLLERYGTVDGTRDNCAAVLRGGGCVLVFPGGAREAFKGKGQDYQLMWGERLGFARMALQCRAQIVPFAALGADEVFNIGLDADGIMASPVGPVLKALGLRKDLIAPVPRVSGPGAMPKAERLYFQFAPPIDARIYDGRDDDAAARSLRNQAQTAIEDAIDQLRAVRAASLS